MTDKELAELMFPDVKHDTEYYENLYPERNLKEGAVVSRFAPKKNFKSKSMQKSS